MVVEARLLDNGWSEDDLLALGVDLNDSYALEVLYLQGGIQLYISTLVVQPQWHDLKQTKKLLQQT